MSKTVETIVKCDICGKEMKESESGHSCFQGYLVLGSNLNEADTKRYGDVCVPCFLAVQKVIAERMVMSSLNSYFSEKLREKKMK